jgi:hypothetical protein
MVETPAGRPVARADTPAGDPPKLVRRDREESPVAVEPSRLSVLPSVTGSFVNFDCAGGKAKVVLQTEGGKKSFVIEDPNNIVVEGHKGGAVELTCGPQKAVRLRVVYADPPKGTAFAGSVKALYFEP